MNASAKLKNIKKNLIRTEHIVTALIIIGIVVFLAMIIITNIFHFSYRLNADISSEAVLAKQIWDVKQLVPKTWYMSTETRIIGTPNLAALFYGITHNMLLAMGLACSTLTLLIICSMFFFGSSLGLKLQDNLLFILMGLACPVLFDFLEMLYLFGCHYAVHVINLFLTMGFYVTALKENRINRKSIVLSVLLAIVFGMQGVREILIFYGPLFGMEVTRNLYRLYCKEKTDRADMLISLWVAVLLIFSFVGTLFPISVSQDELSRNFRKGFQKLFTVIMPNVVTALGLHTAKPAEKAALIIFLLVILSQVLNILWRMLNKKKIKTAEWAFLVICASPVITALIMAFTTFETTERYYFMFTYAMAFAMVLTLTKLRETQNKMLGIALRILISLSAAVIMISNLICIYVPIMKSERTPQMSDYEVVKYLEENDFRIAYSTFDHANNLTVLSNGRIRGAAISSMDKMNVCRWLSSSDWYVPNVPYEERTAYIVPEIEMEKFSKFLDIHRDDIKFETLINNYYYIYSSDYNFSNLQY